MFILVIYNHQITEGSSRPLNSAVNHFVLFFNDLNSGGGHCESNFLNDAHCCCYGYFGSHKSTIVAVVCQIVSFV